MHIYMYMYTCVYGYTVYMYMHMDIQCTCTCTCMQCTVHVYVHVHCMYSLVTIYRHHPGKPRIYFYTGFVAYMLGLGTTVGVMHFFKAAQPALLYLVPSCLGLPFLVALIRGDLPALFRYVEYAFTVDYTGMYIYMYNVHVHMYLDTYS